jgi:bifunctional non-homologous end joining protein LigD
MVCSVTCSVSFGRLGSRVWVEHSLPAKIEYRAKSAEGEVRHPLFRDIREEL